MDDMKKQMAEMRQHILSSKEQRDESNSTPRHESNTPHENIRTKEAINTEKGNAILEEVAESNASMRNDETLTRRRIVNVEKHNRQQGGGRDVILYSITRPLNVAVAKGTIQTTNPKAVVGVSLYVLSMSKLSPIRSSKGKLSCLVRMGMCSPWEMLGENRLHGHLVW